ncbi:hypothetical protein RJ640_015695 [Escallonia rubra]|uniref:TATA-binding protein-associated factor BTAF1 n=1 Tax=Escallonia rubra TaxID=112253 RepID=A0AA88QZD7_9ASTE|nr:hypothetical protein RJ640_015695 [Escallonia rubra]
MEENIAARDIGQIDVSPYLRSKNWDTRVAAAHAIGAIAESVKNTSLTELYTCIETKMSEAGICGSAKDVVAWPNFHIKFMKSTSFRSFDLKKVLEFGALLASGGQEYDIASDNTKNPKERLARQKQNLRRRLGLDVCEQFMDVNDMIRDEDLSSPGNGVAPQYYTSRSVANVKQLVARMVPSLRSRGPSARELNLLKRKAKISSKDQMKGWSKDGDKDIACSQDMTSANSFGQDLSNSNKLPTDTVSDEDSSEHDGDGAWPFQSFVEQLILDMFDPVWEVRHGSVMALREFLTHQGACAGVLMPDLSYDGAFFSEIKEKVSQISIKREREIDLNTQVSADESELILKRPKLEDSTFPQAEAVISARDGYCDTSIKVEDSPRNIPVSQANGKVDFCSVTLEPQSYLGSVSDTCHEAFNVVEARSFEDKDSFEKLDILKSVPEDSELLNLVKLARDFQLKNSEFLQDCAIRFLCILSLDRFGDYVSDQVVAPVRETCAQALGAVLKHMHPMFVHQTLNILLQMQRRPEWEIRHGSLLGIKYLVAVRQEMVHDLLGCVLPACKLGLEDPDDDVRAVAADALIPTAATIVSLKGQSLDSVVMLLWDILLDLDDLSPSTSSVMNLLAELYSQDQMVPAMFGALARKETQEFDLNETGFVSGNLDVLMNAQEQYSWEEKSGAQGLRELELKAIEMLCFGLITLISDQERLLEAVYKRSISESSSSFWPSSILGDTLRIVFQNLLLESNEDILQCSERVWRLLLQCPVEDLEAAAKSYISSWVELAATPYGSPLDAAKMFWPVALPRKSHFKAAAKMRAVKLESDPGRNIAFDFAEGTTLQEKNGDPTSPVKIIVGADLEMSVTHTRVVTATALGVLASRLQKVSVQHVVDPLWKAVTSLSGVQRQVASIILMSWSKEMKSGDLLRTKGVIPDFFSTFKNRLLDLLACADPAFPTKDSLLPYAELSRTYSKMRNEACQLFRAVDSCGMFNDILSSTKFEVESLSADDAMNFASKLPLLSNDTPGEDFTQRNIADELESFKQRLLTTSGYLKCVQSNLHVTVSALVAGAVVGMSELPTKLNPIILPLMASVKREQEEILQNKAAEALAELIYQCIARKPGPNDKLIKNLCSLTSLDPRETPQAGVLSSIEMIDDLDLLFGRSTGKQKSMIHAVASGEDRSRVEGFISRRGSELALKHLCGKFGASLFDKLPKLWDCLTEILKPGSLDGLSLADEEHITQHINSIKDPQILINNIQVLRSIAPMLHESLRPKFLTLLPCIFKCVCHSHVAVRLAASRCITSMAKSMTIDVMAAVIENVVPMLGDITSADARQGAGMLVSLLVQGMGVELVPYAPLLVVPLLRCMGDCDHSVRQSVTHSFAALVPLLPLARGISTPVGLSERLSKNEEDARFLEQLVDNSNIDDYKLSTELKVTLRRYQQEGINWLAFLKRFNLHGVLCDDMGLGKTLQASAIVASDIAEHRASNGGDDDLPSLIVCPSTLVGHWVFEIEKFIDTSVITTLQYVGSAQERSSLRTMFAKHNVIVTSYDVVRKDIDHLRQLLWNFCILDEGHMIKNSKSKITGAVKQLKAQHRLILSGTPIQNNVLELWSLFDFLMPGFLGTERQFQATYGKPLLAARDSRCSAKDAEAGVLAMEALHKQVMPFLLRRTKDEVLSDLPEKIIQDRYCDLSPVQLKLYEQFSGSHARQEISSMVKLNELDTGEGSSSSKASSHVFQALQFLLKLCGHPLLVVGEKTPDTLSCLSPDIFPPSSDIVSELHKLHHSPKLVALQEILEECGIGSEASGSEGAINVGQHRVLIFAQHKAFLDIIERDLFHVHMKNSITYLRLDGSVEQEKRFDIVKAFNSDPTIDALLLTTHVGGLGLNLTSADTLVFMEHDWNPMRDLQAMDRAHRLGQRKVVNVHRLIMRGTIEEKVMSLQKFKVSVANAVINAENASLKTMNTDQLLDLFTPADSKKGGTVSKGSAENFEGEAKLPGGGKGLKAILGGLEELWDQSQYTEEYNLNQFLAKLNG